LEAFVLNPVCLNLPTVTTCILVGCGALVSAPVLIKGFTRRGTGVKYEPDFVIQRAPQMASVLNIVLIVVAFICYNGLLDKYLTASPLIVLDSWREGNLRCMVGDGWYAYLAPFISWLGVALLLDGLVFMIGGWYSMGDCFTTDAEILDGQTVRSDGLLKYVMHPCYSGIIQSLAGASLAATSIPCFLFTIGVVAPLWLNRAKYEEKLLTEALGASYEDYARKMHYRRLVPRIFPIGV
jgi:protein-S-isoprenylcysteine O-methyltransferase Ste14